MAPFPTPISTCNNNTVFNSLPWLTNNFCWKTNREYSVSTHDCDALYWFGCMYSSCIDSILAWWARIWLYTPELCMTLAPLAPPQTYCAASQTNMIIHKHTNTQIHKYSNTQIHKYTNTQILKYTNTQIHTWVMYDTGSISSTTDLLCSLTNKHNTTQSTQRGIEWCIQEKTFFHHQANFYYWRQKS